VPEDTFSPIRAIVGFCFNAYPRFSGGFHFKYLYKVKKWIYLFFLLAGCTKDPETASDNQLPVITLNSPAANQVYTAGQPIVISGNIADNNYIAEVHIHVTNTGTGALLMDVHLYPAGSTASFSQSLTATAGINYRIQVIAKDKAVNEARSTVDVSCN
jgi:Bacterial Ig domain